MTRLMSKVLAASVAVVALVGTAACSGGDTPSEDPNGEDPGAAGSSTGPGLPGPGGSGGPGDSEADPPGTDATLPRIDSCDEVAAVLGSYVDGFEPGGTGFALYDDRYSCEWQRPRDGDRIYGVTVVGHYANTPNFADNDWEVAGFEVLPDARVDRFGGLVLLNDLGFSREVSIQGAQFDLRLQTTGEDEQYLPVDTAVDLMLELIDT